MKIFQSKSFDADRYFNAVINKRNQSNALKYCLRLGRFLSKPGVQHYLSLQKNDFSSALCLKPRMCPFKLALEIINSLTVLNQVQRESKITELG